MQFRTAVIAAVCAVAVNGPARVQAQTRADTVRMRDSIRVQDSVRKAQPPVTSQQRIRVQKEMQGEAAGTIDQAGMRADSIAAAERARADSVERVAARTRDSLAAVEKARMDSIARVETARRDSIAAVERARADSVARADSIAAAEQMRQQQIRDRYRFNGSGWYVGLAGGGSVPMGDFEALGYNSGFNITAPIGWHSRSSFLGARLDLGYNQFAGREFIGNSGGQSVTLANGSPKVISAVLNLTARVPLTASRSVNLYGVGGAGLYHFRSFGGTSALGGFLGNDVLETNESNLKTTRNKLGAQFGAGIDFGAGPASLFIESRVVNVFTDRDDSVQFRDFFGDNRSKTLRWVPIVIGVNIR